jgi:ATP-binding cassette subfamily B multidrug efflux pump
LRRFSRLWPYVRPRLRGFALGLLSLVLASAFQLASPLVLRRAVDALGGPSPGPLLTQYAALFVALAVLQAIMKFGSRQAFLGEARRVEHALRADYFSMLIRLPAGRVESAQKGDLVNRATQDLQDIRMFLGAGAMNFLQTILLVGVAVVLLWRIHPGLTLVSLAPFPVLSWLVRRQSPRLHRRYLEASRKAGSLAAGVQEALSAVRIVRSYHREGWQTERFEKTNLEVRNAEARVVRAWAVLFPAVGFLAGAGQVAVLGAGGYLVLVDALSIGSFVAFNFYVAMLTWPMVALGWTLGLVQRGAAALERLREVLDAPIEADGHAPVPAESAVSIEARGVSFSYDGVAQGTLASLDLTLGAGGYWALVGSTGSGKSTLVAVLSRLRRPSAGEVRVCGVPLDDAAESELRAVLAVVPQDDFFFSATVSANILLGRPRDEGRLAWAVRVASLDGDLAAFPRGVETWVGEGGVTLSGGQRQRLSIARAIYGLPRALFLDAALSSLDAETARRVLSAVRSALPGSTLLVVSHRGSEVNGADRVFFLEKGHLIASGRHAELLERVPEYLRLYREEELRRELEEAVP